MPEPMQAPRMGQVDADFKSVKEAFYYRKLEVNGVLVSILV
jgi:hypothetical protein